jgi:hypothetical protein
MRMNSMQKLVLASGVALACALPLSAAQAGGMKPGWNAYGQLQYGSGWRLYDAGCLTWNYQQHAWYTHCGLPQNAPLHPRPIVAKD